ncbi:hypothetical protein BH09BAC3_BH09BAC3_19740 [soil metagenome]
MLRQKRSFYIIGHNPNTLEEAKEFLDKGANGLEPDIVHCNGKFYISHSPQSSYENIQTVEEYLQGLKALLYTRRYNLAIILWDLKVTDFDINEFMAVVKENFSGGPCNDVVMLLTHSDDHEFVSSYHGQHSNVGIGLDESNVSPRDLAGMFKNSGHKNFSYADGITTVLHKPEVFKNVREALHHRDTSDTNSFKFVYTWVLARPIAMRKYLGNHVDAIMVDIASVDRLKELITTQPYSEAYQLAQGGHNPFSTTIPHYLLTVKTKDQWRAGTNAEFIFTLTGTSGVTLKSLPFIANAEGVFEKGTTSFLTLEGMDVGEIESLAIEGLTSGLGAGWLPEKISVESKMLSRKYEFDFSADKNEWITKKLGPVVKFPSVYGAKSTAG